MSTARTTEAKAKLLLNIDSFSKNRHVTLYLLVFHDNATINRTKSIWKPKDREIKMSFLISPKIYMPFLVLRSFSLIIFTILCLFIQIKAVYSNQYFEDFFQNIDNAPIVFVPGILGSKIFVDGKPIWGKNSWNSPSLSYSKDQIVTTAPLEKLEIRFLLELERNVYGNYFDLLDSDLTNINKIFKFSYDWRASNQHSGKKLHDFICANIFQTNFVIVAHSMGGLVTKHWIKDFYGKKCPDGKVPEVSQIVFVATPHLGAPKSFWSFFHNLSLQKGFDWKVTKGLNTYGYTFDSLYELFPAEHAYRGETQGKKQDRLCILTNYPKKKVNISVTYKSPNRENSDFIDIFDESLFIKFDIFSRFTELGKRKDRLTYLASKLKTAREKICDILEMQIPDSLKGKIHYVGGYISDEKNARAKTRSTITGVKIYSDANEGPHSKIKISSVSNLQYYAALQKGFGDETVPYRVALDLKNGTYSSSEFHIHQINADHEDILNHSQLSTIVDNIRTASAPVDINTYLANSNWKPTEYDSSVYNIKFEAIENTNGIFFTKGGQQSNKPLSVYKLAASALAESQLIREADSDALYLKAKELGNPLLWEAIARSPANIDRTKRLWAFNNAGYEYLKGQKLAEALRVLSDAEIEISIHGEKNVHSIRPEMLYNNIGWTLVNSENYGLAKEYFEKAINEDPEYRKAIIGIKLVNENYESNIDQVRDTKNIDDTFD